MDREVDSLVPNRSATTTTTEPSAVLPISKRLSTPLGMFYAASLILSLVLTILATIIFASTKKFGNDDLSDNKYAYIIISILLAAALGSLIYSLIFFIKLFHSDFSLHMHNCCAAMWLFIVLGISCIMWLFLDYPLIVAPDKVRCDRAVPMIDTGKIHFNCYASNFGAIIAYQVVAGILALFHMAFGVLTCLKAVDLKTSIVSVNVYTPLPPQSREAANESS